MFWLKKIDKSVAYIIPLCHRKLRSNLNKEETSARIEAINTCVYEFIKNQTGVNIELVFIEQVIDDEYYLKKIKDFESSNIRVKKISVKYPVFNKCWLYNIAVSHVKSDHILFSEGDVFSKENFFSRLVEYTTNLNLKWCFAWDKIYYTNEAERKALISGKNIFMSEKEFKIPEKHRREGGIVYIRKDFFKQIGGYNEWIEELGGPDNDIAARMFHHSKTYRKFSNTIIHLWHTRDVDKYKPTRKRNIVVMKITFESTSDVIKMLRRQRFGDIDGPLCSKAMFFDLPWFPINLDTNKQKEPEVHEEPETQKEPEVHEEPASKKRVKITKELREKVILKRRKIAIANIIKKRKMRKF